jgi:outer membrane protein assembly factor BamB
VLFAPLRPSTFRNQADFFMQNFSWLTVLYHLLLLGQIGAQDLSNWPQWRGRDADGLAPEAKPPINWSATENVRWKTAIPGKGHSTPIVWADRVFVTTAIAVGEKLPPKMSGRPGEHNNSPVDSAYEFVLLALDRSSGHIIWQHSLHREIPIEAGHVTASLASASPVTDGTYVIANFGPQGLYCLDFAGNLLWKRNLGAMHTKHGHGMGSSPALSGELLIVNWDHEEGSFVTALDKKTGEVRWRNDRIEDTSWSSPLVIQQPSGPQVVICSTNYVRGYDRDTGQEIWSCEGMSSNVVTTPVYSNGALYVGSSYEKKVIMAIDVGGAQGDISSTPRIKWTRNRGTPYVPSMLLYGDGLYFLSHYQNVLTRVTAATGKDSPGAVRIEGLTDIYSSPVGANGFIFVTDLEGTTAVLTHSEIPRMVAINRLDEPVAASLALVDGQIFIRGQSHLYCIEQEQ